MTGYLDGNALAGALSELFAIDLTAATGRCAECGHRAALADTRVYLDCPGIVVRCRACDGVLLTIVQHGDAASLNLHGLAGLAVTLPEED